MKKLIALILSVLVLLPVVLLTSCTSDPSQGETKTETSSVESTESESASQTTPYPQVDGTDDPNDPLFSRYAVNGNYYAYLERYTNNGFSVNFDIQARKMNIINPKGGATICTYDKNYFLTRIDMSESVITIENEIGEDGLLTVQKIVYRSGETEQHLTLTYKYDEESRIVAMVLTDLDEGKSILDTDFLYCGNGSYLIRDRSSSGKKYFHLNYLLTEDPITELRTKVQKNGDVEVTFSVGPLVNNSVTMTRVGGESCKMYNEFCLFTAMFSRLTF